MTRRAYDLPTESEIIRLYRAGATTYELAEQFGGTNRSIANALQRNGVERRRGGKTSSWKGTPEQRQKVRALYAQIGSVREVARVVGTRTQCVTDVLVEEGVSLKPGGRLVFDDDQCREIAARYAEGLSLAAVAREYDSNTNTITEAIKRGGGMIRRAGRDLFWTVKRERFVLERYAEGVGRVEIASELGVSRGAITSVLRRNGIAHEAMSGPRHHSWNGGRHVDSQGYVRVKVAPEDLSFCRPLSNGYVLEHRLVMGRALGRPLLPHETVHHIDGDHGNNKLDNLQLRFGRHGKGIALQCHDCGSQNVRPVPLAE